MSRPSTSAESDAYDDGRSEAKDAEQGANDKANVEQLDHTTSIAMRPASVILPPEPAKPSPCRSTAPTTPPPSSSPPTSPPPDAPMATSIPMPGLSNLILHSPSATIVGTPFALDTDITRFEYPFPDTSLSPPGLYEYHNTSGGSSSGSASGSGRLGVPALSHSSSSGSSGPSSSSASCTSSAAPSPSHPPSHTHHPHDQHYDPHHPQHQFQQHPQHSQHTHQHVHIVSRHATHPIHIPHIPHIAHPHAISNHPISQSPPGSAFPLALTSSLTSAKSSHPSHHHHTRSHQHSHSNSHNSHSNTHPSQHQHQHPLSPNASALLADSDREEPPVPPGLLKKKHRWSLGLLSTPHRTSTPQGQREGRQREGRQREGAGEQRRSATMDHYTTGKNAANGKRELNEDANTNAAEYFDVSPGSCTSESSVSTASTTSSAVSDTLHALHALDALHISDSDTLQGSDTEPSKLGVEEEEEVQVGVQEGVEEEEERTMTVTVEGVGVKAPAVPVQ